MPKTIRSKRMTFVNEGKGPDNSASNEIGYGEENIDPENSCLWDVLKYRVCGEVGGLGTATCGRYGLLVCKRFVPLDGNQILDPVGALLAQRLAW